MLGGLTRIEGMKNLSSCLQGGCEILPLVKHEERQTRLRFLCQVSSPFQLSHFPWTNALQYCKLILPRSIGCGGVGTRRPTNVATVAALPPMTVLLFRYRRSFHFQFTV